MSEAIECARKHEVGRGHNEALNGIKGDAISVCKILVAESEEGDVERGVRHCTWQHNSVAVENTDKVNSKFGFLDEHVLYI